MIRPEESKKKFRHTCILTTIGAVAFVALSVSGLSCYARYAPHYYYSMNRPRPVLMTKKRKTRYIQSKYPPIRVHGPRRIDIDYTQPSMWRPYPKLQATDRIVVATDKQRAYVQRPYFINGRKHYKLIYKMFISTGMNHSTPYGSYRINNVRSKWFYSPRLHEGASYATGWHDGGVYLFHSTPANADRQVFLHTARQLGERPSSHGCVHLTIPDAKWLYEYAPTGMQVLIVHDAY